MIPPEGCPPMPEPPEPAIRPPGIPEGRCWCGCGRPTRIATRTRSNLGIKRGQHLRYVDGHHPRPVYPPCDGDLHDCPNPGCTQLTHPETHPGCADRHPLQTGKGCTTCTRKPKPVTMDPRVAAEEWEHFGNLLGWTTKKFATRFNYTEDGIRKLMLGLPEDNEARVSFLAAWEREHTQPDQPGSFSAPRGSISGVSDRPGRPFVMRGSRIA